MEDIDEYETRHVNVSFLDTYIDRYAGGNCPTQSDIDESTIDIALDMK